jgi:tetratricopeptide (TPR) repeat protein
VKQWWATRIVAGLRAGTVAVCLTLLSGAAVRPAGQPAVAADAQLQQIRASIDQGRYLEAEAASRELLSAIDARRGHAPIDAAPALDALVEALVRNGRGSDPQTRVLADRAIAARETAAEPNPLGLADSLCNLGDVLVERGDYDLARAPYNRALALRERALGRGHPAVAHDLDRLARALTLAERYDEALVASDRALAIRSRPTARTPRWRGRSRSALGSFSCAAPTLTHVPPSIARSPSARRWRRIPISRGRSACSRSSSSSMAR